MSCQLCVYFFFNDTATTEIYTLSLHDALPIFGTPADVPVEHADEPPPHPREINPEISEGIDALVMRLLATDPEDRRSEEHTSELQSRQYLVCRLLLEKKKSRECSTNAYRHTLP